MPPGIGRAAPDVLLNSSQSEQNTKLYRSYAMYPGTRRVLRHRGKSPRQAAFFFKSPESKFQSAQLASLFLIYDLVEALQMRSRRAFESARSMAGCCCAVRTRRTSSFTLLQ
jgi:hypothetical protein